MNPKIWSVPIIVFVLSLPAIGLASAQTGNETQGIACTQDDIKNAKDGIEGIKEKVGQLRAKYQDEWKSAYDSGQYNGTLEQYTSDKMRTSDDMMQLKSQYMKFSSTLTNCSTVQYQPANTIQTASGIACSGDATSHAKQEFSAIQKQYDSLKAKAYNDFQQALTTGYNGTWQDYAQDNLVNLPEMVKIKATHDRLAAFLNRCNWHQPHPGLGTNYTSHDIEPNANDNTVNLPHPTQQDAAANINPSSALAATAGQGIPAWVRGVAGWWAEGKISDGDFVSAIKFLVQQGIIRI